MTGFGVGEAAVADGRVVAEARSVNQRFLDVRAKLPRDLSELTLFAEQVARERLRRGRVEIVVSDDGKGLPRKVVPTTGWGHFGLAMMREHVEDAGGTFIIQSAARQGTRIIARLPLPGVRTS